MARDPAVTGPPICVSFTQAMYPQGTMKHTLATLLAQADHFIDEHTGAVTPPIYHSSTFARDGDYQLRSHGGSYGRSHNPTNQPAESLLAKLEGGEEALLFSSGLAAATSIFTSLSTGDRVAIPEDMYHGLRDWLLNFGERWGLGIDLYDGADLQTLERVVQSGKTRVVWVETPSNPVWKVTDISAVSEIAHRVGAQVAVDSTISTPILTRPLEHGADLVFHSCTKYLNGHSDLIAGALVCKEQTPLWEGIRFQRTYGGAILGPSQAWLLLRGMRTLHVRMRAACENAIQIANFLQTQPEVEEVLYAGLPEHPGHQIAARQMTGGFGAVLSFLVRGDAQYAKRVASGTRLFVPATSLGGVESLIEHRHTVEGANSTVAPNLIRISVGIEDAGELIEDLGFALAHAQCCDAGPLPMISRHR
jgi:cystathionine gamma-synthase